MLARIAAICTIATLAYAAPTLAESTRTVVYGPEVTDQLEKFLPLEIGATDCWKAAPADGPISDIRFTLLVQGPGYWDDPGIFRYHYEIEATERATGLASRTSDICLSSDEGITCESECEGGSLQSTVLEDGTIKLSTDGLRLRYCGGDADALRLAGEYHLTRQDGPNCPVFVPRDPEGEAE